MIDVLFSVNRKLSIRSVRNAKVERYFIHQMTTSGLQRYIAKVYEDNIPYLNDFSKMIYWNNNNLTNSTMHLCHIHNTLFRTEMCAPFCLEWCIVGYGIFALWMWSIVDIYSSKFADLKFITKLELWQTHGFKCMFSLQLSVTPYVHEILIQRTQWMK